MLRITVELIPMGVETASRVISQIQVANTGERLLPDRSNYRYKGWIQPMDGSDDMRFDGFVSNERTHPLSLLFLMRKILSAILYPEE